MGLKSEQNSYYFSLVLVPFALIDSIQISHSLNYYVMDRDICEKSESLLKSSRSFITCETLEEERLRSLLRFAAANLSIVFYEWSIVEGLKKNGQTIEDETQDPIACLTFIKSHRGSSSVC